MKNLANALRSEEDFEGKNNENGTMIKRRGDPPPCRVNY